MAIATPPTRRRSDPDPLRARPATPPVDQKGADDGPPMLFMRGPIRLVAFTLLALLVGRRWARLADPVLGPQLLRATAVAAGVGVFALLIPKLGRPIVRRAAWVALALAGAAGVLLAAGVPLELLAPKRWGEVSAGISTGVNAIPDLRVPYRGEDPWVRITIALGGGLLLLIASAVCLVGRGRPFVATIILAATYTLAIVQVEERHSLGDGVLLTLATGLLLLGDRVPMSQVRAAGVTLLGVLGIGIVAVPLLNADRPWIDYRHLTEQLGKRPTTAFDWSHGYGPLPWARDGRQVLRVRAPRPSYWKGITLDAFDGLRWTTGRFSTPGTTPAERSKTHPGWLEQISVSVQDMRSTQLYAPGEILDIVRASTKVRPDTPGTVVTERRPVTRGDNYLANVYVPSPTVAELRASTADYPYEVVRDSLSLGLPPSGAAAAVPDTPGRPAPTGPTIIFPAYGSGGSPRAVVRGGDVAADGDQALRDSAYRRTWALAQTLLAQSTSPYDYVRRVMARVRAGAVYDERPPAADVPLESFLFDTRRGYCQQFSGAMALLLRMGGIPSRVAEGFTPGTLDTGKGEYVVRDTDAHSWVEFYVPKVGWTVVDPTPASAPAVRSLETATPSDSASLSSSSDAGGPKVKPTAGTSAATDGGGGGGGDLPAIVLSALLLGALGVGGMSLRSWRQRAAAPDPELWELRRALARAGRPAPPGATLASLEAAFPVAGDARRYFRQLSAARYDVHGGATPVRPTTAARRGLRRALVTGDGPLGRLRALWALPPRLPQRGAEGRPSHSPAGPVRGPS